MSHVQVEKQTHRYVATVDGAAGEAELIFTMIAPDLMAANHAYAPPNLRGSGAALALVERMVADARAEGFKVRPLCSYVRAKFRERDDWRDVLA